MVVVVVVLVTVTVGAVAVPSVFKVIVSVTFVGVVRAVLVVMVVA